MIKSNRYFSHQIMKLMMNYGVKVLLVIIAIIGIHSCNDEKFTNDPSDKIRVSSDTLAFDTIFTEIGSVTKQFKIYNPNNKSIELSQIYIQGGAQSNFRINVDGVSGNSHTNVVILPKDSLYIFVEVTLDPVGGNLPLVIYDAVVFEYNNNTTSVTLEAFGQDVHLIKGLIIETQTWTNDKPYLVYHGVAIDSNHILTINAGVKVYFHYNSSLIVWGTVKVNGTFEEPVVFEGDRFDRGYGETAGRWGTIFIDSKSRGNEVNYAIIKNALAGFQVGEPREDESVPSLILRNTYITNTTLASVIAYGAEITAYNSIFSDSQFHGLALIMGGKYNFFHSSVSIVGAIEVDRGTTSYTRARGSNVQAYGLILSNWQPYYTLNENFMVDQNDRFNDLVEANFYNSIIYGSKELEFIADTNQNADLNYYFDHCILKQTEDSLDLSDKQYFNKVFLNEDPRFVNDSAILGELDYRLDTLSPAKDSGSVDIVNLHLEYLEYDYDGNSRTADGMPDLGAFERIE